MLKVMIIGAGGIAPAHIEGFLEFKNKVKIVAIANRSIGRAEKLIEKYSLDAKAVSDYRELIDDVDIAAICTPPGSHKEIAVTCLNKKKHVLLEKPMAISLEDCDEIIKAARENDMVLSVVAQSRFTSSVSNIVKMIHKGDYGKVLYAYVNSLWWRGQNYYDLAWRGRWETEGGGCTLNQGVHHIDLLLWVKGMPVEVTTVMSNLAHDNSEEEDISVSILKYGDGTMAQLTCSTINHGEQQWLNFQMEKAGVSIPFEVKANKERSNGFPLDDEETKERFIKEYQELPKLEHEGHAGQVGDFLDCILTGKKPLIDGESGRNTIELITAIYKSASTKQTVKLPLSPDDDFYTHEGVLKNIIYFNEKKRFVEAFEDTTITSFNWKS